MECLCIELEYIEFQKCYLWIIYMLALCNPLKESHLSQQSQQNRRDNKASEAQISFWI
jgi:hypothetical protein